MGFNWLHCLVNPIERKSLASPDAVLLELFDCAQTAAGVAVTVVPVVLAAIRSINDAAASLPAHVAHDEYERDDSHPAHALLTASWNESISACAGRRQTGAFPHNDRDLLWN